MDIITSLLNLLRIDVKNEIFGDNKIFNVEQFVTKINNLTKMIHKNSLHYARFEEYFGEAKELYTEFNSALDSYFRQFSDQECDITFSVMPDRSK